MQTTPSLLNIAKNIQLLILDVDGVLTDGSVTLCSNGDDIKSFHSHDGQGIRSVQEAGIPVAIISGRTSQAVVLRMQELDVKTVHQGQKVKTKAFEAVLKHYQVSADQVAYVGDDLPDLTVMKRVGLPVAVANAVNAVKQSTPWHTSSTGGKGAVREVCDILLQARTPVDDIAVSTISASV
mgnify:CR=1 FL=1